MKDLCDACGITEAVTDVAVFLHKPCTISVGIERDKEGIYSDKNKVTRIASAAPASMPPPRGRARRETERCESKARRQTDSWTTKFLL